MASRGLGVLDSLRLGRFADERARRVGQVRRAIDRTPFPPLTELATFPQWVSWRSRQGADVTYGQAFLAVDLLIERRGHPAAVDYFRRFARVDDRLGNFRAAFGQDLTAFDREFAAHLRDLRSEELRDPARLRCGGRALFARARRALQEIRG